MRSMHTKNLYWGDSTVRILAGKAVPDNHVFSLRRDTLVQTLRQTYGEDFAPGVTGRMQLGTLLDREDASSLTELLKRHKK
jgi:hypothetical protein